MTELTIKTLGGGMEWGRCKQCSKVKSEDQFDSPSTRFMCSACVDDFFAELNRIMSEIRKREQALPVSEISR